ncbi:hypothetical protein ABMA28_012177 [Loxostege sticticalis]|uniref:Uncharacterized protein n=1 Tax=Loxostege sticticalis TaxID=481309 RepID=A0ABD0TLX0_LOXSC
MEQGIATSDGTDHKRVYILITLNVLGVIACFFTLIVLILWALQVIFPEPIISPLLTQFLHKRFIYRKRISVSVREWNGLDDIFQ